MGLFHLDAGVVIGLLDSGDAHHLAVSTALAERQRGGNRFAMAESAFAECLVGPSRRGERATRVVDDLFDRLPILVVDCDSNVASAAAALRARHPKLRLPDALVVATAIERSADELVTTDRGWPAAGKLRTDLVITRL